MIGRIIAILVLPVLSFTSVKAGGGDFNKEVAIAYGVASAKEAIDRRIYGYRFGDSLLFDKGQAHSVTDGNGREFVMVSFPSTETTKGFSVVFELCRGQSGEYQHSYFGFVENVSKEIADFLTTEGDKTADFPGHCYWFVP